MAIAEMIEDRIDGFSKSGIIHRLTRDLGRGPAKAAEKFIHENTETLRDKQRALELAQVLRNSAVDGFEKRGLPIPRELAAILNKRGP